jgi:hypothetical protein
VAAAAPPRQAADRSRAGARMPSTQRLSCVCSAGSGGGRGADDAWQPRRSAAPSTPPPCPLSRTRTHAHARAHMLHARRRRSHSHTRPTRPALVLSRGATFTRGARGRQHICRQSRCVAARSHVVLLTACVLVELARVHGCVCARHAAHDCPPPPRQRSCVTPHTTHVMSHTYTPHTFFSLNVIDSMRPCWPWRR